MAATEGNKFWEQRTKHGRDMNFSSPTVLWESAKEYFEWCETHPLKETQAKVVSTGNNLGSDIETVELPIVRAFTLMGLSIYLDCSSSYFRAFKSTARKELENAEIKPERRTVLQDFLTVIEKIEEVIYTQQFTNAAGGLLKENIISRNLGLKDRTDVTTDDERIQVVTGMEIVSGITKEQPNDGGK